LTGFNETSVQASVLCTAASVLCTAALRRFTGASL